MIIVPFYHLGKKFKTGSTSAKDSGGGTQAEPDGHNINKTACYQIT